MTNEQKDLVLDNYSLIYWYAKKIIWILKNMRIY